MLTVLAIAFTAFLNRVRGGGFWGDKLPSRPLFWITPVIVLIAFAFKPILVAVALGATYLFWGIWPWGHLYSIGRLSAEQMGREISDLEAMLLNWVSDNYFWAFVLRHLFVLPGLILAVVFGGPFYLLILAPIFAVLAAQAYELAWRHHPTNPIWVAELLTGALWGVLLVI